MTTLPQSSTPRLGQTLPAIAGAAGFNGAAPGATAGFTLNGSDIWRIIRGNIWLILLCLVLAGGAGYGANRLLLRYWPQYRAKGYLAVQTTVIQDPVTDRTSEMGDARIMSELRTQANLLTTERLLNDVLRNEDVRKTGWFQSFGGKDAAGQPTEPDARRAREYLLEHLQANPVADSTLLEISFSCGNPKDAVQILKQVATIHLNNQREAAGRRNDNQATLLEGIRSGLAKRLEEISSHVRNTEVSLASKGMGGAGFFSTREARLRAMLEHQFKLESEASEAEARWKRIDAQKTSGQVPAEVLQHVENDPTVSSFIRESLSLEIQRDTNMGLYGPQSKMVEGLKAMIDQTKSRLDARRQELTATLKAQYAAELEGKKIETASDLKSVRDGVADLEKELSQLMVEAATLRHAQDEEKSLREKVQAVEGRIREFALLKSDQSSQGRISWRLTASPSSPRSPFSRSSAGRCPSRCCWGCCWRWRSPFSASCSTTPSARRATWRASARSTSWAWSPTKARTPRPPMRGWPSSTLPSPSPPNTSASCARACNAAPRSTRCAASW